MSRLIFFCALFFGLSSVSAQELEFENRGQEALYKQMISELRCLVCQNQNLADSGADLAKDLRGKTYGLVKGGASKAEIIEYMVNRYGDFVLYRPPFKVNTLALWIGPFVFLLIGLIVIVSLHRRHKKRPEVVLSAEDQRRARRLLDEDRTGSR